MYRIIQGIASLYILKPNDIQNSITEALPSADSYEIRPSPITISDQDQPLCWSETWVLMGCVLFFFSIFRLLSDNSVHNKVSSAHVFFFIPKLLI